jgi:hypothetical protein
VLDHIFETPFKHLPKKRPKRGAQRLTQTGFEYNEGDVDSLDTAFEKYLTDPDLLEQQGLNARTMAEGLFDQNRTYPVLAAFIIETDSP